MRLNLIILKIERDFLMIKVVFRSTRALFQNQGNFFEDEGNIFKIWELFKKSKSRLYTLFDFSNAFLLIVVGLFDDQDELFNITIFISIADSF